MSNIGVIGAGTWWMALARMLSNSGHHVEVWSALSQKIDELNRTGQQRNLPDMLIPDEIIFTKDAERVCAYKDILLFAVPSNFVRSTANIIGGFVKDGKIIIDVPKRLKLHQ